MRVPTVLLVVTLTLTGLPATATAVPPCPTPAAGASSRHLGAVTLITGDHVTVRQVGRRLAPQVTPGTGREHVRFLTTGVDDELTVVPSDAAALVRSGRLDRRLFDVAALLRTGYGDAARDDLPLLVRSPADLAALTGAGATVGRSAGPVTALLQPKRRAGELWQSLREADALDRATGTIWLDGLRQPSLDVSVPRIGAPAAWQAGYTGEGVTVAVLDTGIDATHPDFHGRLDALQDFTGDRDIRDIVGHGTHVASTIAGSGAASGGRHVGVAPRARLLIGKVCTPGGCPESAILAGMEWAARSGAAVVNLSLGGPDTVGEDPLEEAVNRLTAQHGTLFVVAAGNSGGYGSETVSSPASADSALAVGAVDDNDTLADFSGRGPRFGDAALKPEIVAPGVEITAARSRFSSLGQRGSHYDNLSGTSMATPHVAGAAAVLAHRHPGWTGPRLKAALMGSALPLDGLSAYEQGAGRVDLARAVSQDVHALPGGLSMGRAAWPHADDPLVSRPVTYHNPGDRPRTLSLSVAANGPDGAPAPEGMVRLSTTEITVPAGGQAPVELTVDTALPAAEGAFSARILATDGEGLTVRTPVAIDREPESYDLTLAHRDRDGAPTDLHYSFLVGLDEPRYRGFSWVGEGPTVRVRKGRYHLDAVIITPHADGRPADLAKVAHPVVDVAADTTVVLDARAAQPVSVSFARPGVQPQAVGVGYGRFTTGITVFTGVLGTTFAPIFTGQVGDAVAAEEMVGEVGGAWAVPDGTGDVTASTVAYHLMWFERGRLPTGFSRAVPDAGLAEVHTTYRAQSDRARATKVWVAREPDLDVGLGFGFGFRLPLTRTEYHNVDGLHWSGELQQWRLVDRAVHLDSVLTGAVVDHLPGQSYQDDWNSAVFGPGLGGGDSWAVRYGDLIAVNVPLHSDATLDRTGMSEVDEGETVLYRDGVRIGDSATAGQGSFDVPAEPGVYRLETTATRGGTFELSTTISCVWTFSSARPAETEPGPKAKGGMPLGLMAVRFAPPGLDPDNTLTADSARVPVTVQWHPGVPPATLTELTVEVSFDEGRTWRAVEVDRDTGATAVARIDHPQGARHVSLRARAADSAGSSVEQTIIRAYRT